MEDNKRDFLNNNDNNDNGHNEPEERRDSDRQEQEPGADKSSYYYSYGPFKTYSEQTPQESGRPLGFSSDKPIEAQPASNVEINTPKPIRSYSESEESVRKPVPAAPQWGYKPPKRSVFKSTVASFLAGALVVGSLMFASDKWNWFTGDQALSSQAPAVSSAVNTSTAGGSGKPVNAALNLSSAGDIAGMVEKASPAVVKIQTYVKNSRSSSNSFFDDPSSLWQYFGDSFGGSDSDSGTDQNKDSSGLQELGEGSGFFFDKDGYILTNQHVIDGADEIKVQVQGYDKPFTAKLMGNEFDLDLAVLKIEGSNFPTLAIGDSNATNVGDWVVAIGNPYGFDHTVTVGVLSAKERPISISEQNETRKYEHLLQTDASINPGNSGGPLLNTNGEVIGINTAVSSQAQGIGFAIPTSTIKENLENLKNNVKTPKPWVGVSLRDIQKTWVDQLKLSSTNGSIVAGVYDNSPADKAGLQTYDVITELNGKAIKNSEELTTQIQKLKVGDKATLTIIRDGRKMTTAVILEDMNKAQQ